MNVTISTLKSTSLIYKRNCKLYFLWVLGNSRLRTSKLWISEFTFFVLCILFYEFHLQTFYLQYFLFIKQFRILIFFIVKWTLFYKNMYFLFTKWLLFFWSFTVTESSTFPLNKFSFILNRQLILVSHLLVYDTY